MLGYGLMISNSLLAGERVLLECQQRIDFHRPCFPWFSNCNIHCVEHAVYTLPNWFKTPKLGCQLECQRRNFHHTVSKDQPYSTLLIRFFLKGAAVRYIFLGIWLSYTKCCLCMMVVVVIVLWLCCWLCCWLWLWLSAAWSNDTPDWLWGLDDVAVVVVVVVVVLLVVLLVVVVCCMI